METFGNQTSLVPINRAMKISFSAENPFITYNILTGIGS